MIYKTSLKIRDLNNCKFFVTSSIMWQTCTYYKPWKHNGQFKILRSSHTLLHPTTIMWLNVLSLYLLQATKHSKFKIFNNCTFFVAPSIMGQSILYQCLLYKSHENGMVKLRLLVKPTMSYAFDKLSCQITGHSRFGNHLFTCEMTQPKRKSTHHITKE